MANQTGTNELAFRKTFGDIGVEITGPGAQADVRVVGPKAFVEQIDWDRVHETARLFAAYTDPCMALALAVHEKYAAWHGTQDVLRRLHN